MFFTRRKSKREENRRLDTIVTPFTLNVTLTILELNKFSKNTILEQNALHATQTQKNRRLNDPRPIYRSIIRQI